MSRKKIDRRELIGAIGAAGAAVAFGCGSSDGTTSPTTTTPATTTGNNAACAVTPSETAGPFPSLTDLFRIDIREGKSGTLLALAAQTYSRGIQTTNSNGEVTFLTTYPGWSKAGPRTFTPR